ncbi:MAG: divalent-cation tolerance protein CutA [Chrysiogenales bacterium]|nr:MAG: divalent-cation tolerance protein CutA [Chrysiogenales bacterium]
MGEYIVILCTVPSNETGTTISDSLVGDGFAACVNMIPGLISTYRWKGEICRDGELLLVIKSRKELFSEICARIVSLHPYEVPEILSFEISSGSEQYLNWISESTPSS